MKKLILASVVVGSAALSGCAVGVFPGGPTVAGGLMTNVTAPAQNLTVAIDPAAKPVKEGSASNRAVLGLFATGDASVNAAMKAGGITKVHNVDHTVNTILFGLYAQQTTTVHGE